MKGNNEFSQQHDSTGIPLDVRQRHHQKYLLEKKPEFDLLLNNLLEKLNAMSDLANILQPLNYNQYGAGELRDIWGSLSQHTFPAIKANFANQLQILDKLLGSDYYNSAEEKSVGYLGEFAQNLPALSKKFDALIVKFHEPMNDFKMHGVFGEISVFCHEEIIPHAKSMLDTLGTHLISLQANAVSVASRAGHPTQPVMIKAPNKLRIVTLSDLQKPTEESGNNASTSPSSALPLASTNSRGTLTLPDIYVAPPLMSSSQLQIDDLGLPPGLKSLVEKAKDALLIANTSGSSDKVSAPGQSTCLYGTHFGILLSYVRVKHPVQSSSEQLTPNELKSVIDRYNTMINDYCKDDSPKMRDAGFALAIVGVALALVGAAVLLAATPSFIAATFAVQMTAAVLTTVGELTLATGAATLLLGCGLTLFSQPNPVGCALANVRDYLKDDKQETGPSLSA